MSERLLLRSSAQAQWRELGHLPIMGRREIGARMRLERMLERHTIRGPNSISIVFA